MRAVPGAATPAVATTPAVRQQQLAAAFAKLPVTFTENRGQTDYRVRYYAQGSQFGFFMTPSEIVMSLTKRHGPAAAQTADQSRSRSASRPEPAGRAAGHPALRRCRQRPAWQ